MAVAGMTTGKTTYKDLLRIKPFRNLWLGQTISQLGDALYYLVFLFMVDKLTGDPKMVALSGIMQTLPFLLLAPYAGVVADRADRKGIMLRADLLSALVLFAFGLLVLLDTTPAPWVLIATGTLLSCINVFFAPAKSAAIPQLAPPEMLMTANALSMATQNLMPMLGVALSGTVLALLYAVSPAWFFLSAIGLNSLSFLVSALFIRQLPELVPAKQKAHAGEGNRSLKDAIEGLKYLRDHKALWTLLWVGLLVQMAISPFMVVYVQVNSEWFGGGYGTLALCETSFFVGVVLCSVFMERLPIHRPGIAYIWSLFIIGITVAFMAVSHAPAPFAFWNLMAGLAYPFAQIPMTTYVQRTVPENFQGRVNAVIGMASIGIQPVGIGVGGILLSLIGPEGMLMVMGIGMALAALVGLASREFRAARMDD